MASPSKHHISSHQSSRIVVDMFGDLVFRAVQFTEMKCGGIKWNGKEKDAEYWK